MSSSCLKSIFSSKKNSLGEFFFENTNFEFDSRAELPRTSCQMLDPKKVTKKSDLERSEMFQFWQHRLLTHSSPLSEWKSLFRAHQPLFFDETKKRQFEILEDCFLCHAAAAARV